MLAPDGDLVLAVDDAVRDLARQIITTASGERLVVIPEAEYRAMREALEDLEDIAAFEAPFFFAGSQAALERSSMERLLVVRAAARRAWC